MTENNPTMIDGVDVSKCEFYNTDDKTCREVNGKYDTDICEFDKCENYNCRFKQLARKTQECEKLQQEKELYKTWYRAKHDDLKDYLGKLNAEKKQVEQKLKRIREVCKPYTNLPIDEFVKILQIIDEVE